MNKKLKQLLKPAYTYIRNSQKNSSNYLRRKRRKIYLFFVNKHYENSYSFVILCVKNNAYSKLAIDNINSLHYYNPTHKFEIHCDNICYNYYLKNKNKIDYNNNVKIINIFKNKNKAWQLFKIKTLIRASKNNQILIDADEIWHCDPIINKEKIIFQTFCYNFKDNVVESSLIKNLFKQPSWLEFGHHVTGFLSLPSKFMSDKLANDCLSFTKKILLNDLSFLIDDSKINSTKRISEEIALNIAIQLNCDKNNISTLKKTDPKGDKNIIQSLYYGCKNNILK